MRAREPARVSPDPTAVPLSSAARRWGAERGLDGQEVGRQVPLVNVGGQVSCRTSPDCRPNGWGWAGLGQGRAARQGGRVAA